MEDLIHLSLSLKTGSTSVLSNLRSLTWIKVQQYTSLEIGTKLYGHLHGCVTIDFTTLVNQILKNNSLHCGQRQKIAPWISPVNKICQGRADFGEKTLRVFGAGCDNRDRPVKFPCLNADIYTICCEDVLEWSLLFEISVCFPNQC